jgi:glycolate oxidase FAD binding subunit
MSSSSMIGALGWSELEAMVEVRAENPRNIGGADKDGTPEPCRVVAPSTEEQLIKVLRWANENHARVMVGCAGTKIGWGNCAAAPDLIVSVEKFQAIVDHAWQDMTVTVQAGVPFDWLQRELAKHGQRVPLDVLWPEHSTVGGVIATNDSGPLRVRFGSVRDLLLGITVVLANGTIARSGGRVVKNVAGYDLPKLFTGSFGTLGVITEVTLRTYPLPHSVSDQSFRFVDPTSANVLMLAIADSTLVPASVQMRVTERGDCAVDVRFEGVESGVASQSERLVEIAGSAEHVKTPVGAWLRERLFEDEQQIVAKFSVLPTKIAEAVKAIRALSPEARMVVQSLGLGMFCAGTRDVAAMRRAIQSLGGTMTILHAPTEIKREIDVFGECPSAYPLMVRVKQQFDPNGILNPGRFVGGI